MKIVDFILRNLARTVAMRWQGGPATIIFDVPFEMTTPVTPHPKVRQPPASCANSAAVETLKTIKN